MKKNKLKTFLLAISLTTTISIVPTILVSCSARKTSSENNSENNSQTPGQPNNPDVNLPNNPSDNENNQNENLISPNGGTYNGLYVDKYLEIVKALNLLSTTNITELNDDNLNLNLHKLYPDLNVNILNGSSEYTGILNLKLTSNNNKKIINEQIVINGFNIDKYSKFEIVTAEINLNEWFNNFQPIQNQNNLNIKQDLNLLSNFSINIDNSHFDQDNYESKFKISPIFILNNDKLSIDFDIQQCFKIYENNNWIVKQYNKLSPKNPTNNFNLQLPTLNDLFTFILEQIKIIDESAYNYYASYFMGIGVNSIKNEQPQSEIFNFLNVNEIMNKYKSSYFPNIKYEVVINSNSNFNANDLLGKLSFSVFIKNLDSVDIDNISASHNLILSGFKILNIDSQEFNNYISVNRDSNLYNQLKTIFSNEITKINSDSQTINNIEKIGLNSLLNNYFSTIFYDGMDSKVIEQKINIINNNYLFTMFNNPINNFNTNLYVNELTKYDFNPNLSLYNLGENNVDIIYIKSIDINLDNNSNKISLNERNNPVIEIFGTISITLANNHTVMQNINLICEFFQTIHKNNI